VLESRSVRRTITAVRGKLRYINRNPIVWTTPVFALGTLSVITGPTSSIQAGVVPALFLLSVVQMIQRHRQGLQWIEGVHWLG
jgi:hypothetical protein